MKTHKYIYRVPGKSPKGRGAWQVSIDNLSGKVYQRFPDHKFGGSAAAFKAAKQFRDKCVAKFGLQKEVQRKPNPVPGVGRTESRRIRNGQIRVEAVWQAYWQKADGTQDTKRFSIKKYGEDEARRLAISHRKQAIQQISRGEDPFFEVPPSAQSLWRYMDFTKFMSMLEDSSLFFSVAEDFEDPFEGSFSVANVKRRNFVLSRSSRLQVPARKLPSSKFAINCWYAANHESAAMWTLYARSADAIAIRTNVERLRRSLPRSVKLGKVKYVDYTTAWIPEDNPVHRFFFKRLSFEHENEVRAILGPQDIDRNCTVLPNGAVKVKVDLSALILEIFVGPKSNDWFVDLVVQVAARYGISVKPRRSNLYGDPIY